MKKNDNPTVNPWDGYVESAKTLPAVNTLVEKTDARNLPLHLHLQELRQRFLIWLMGMIAAFIILFTWWGDDLMQLVTGPVRQLNIEFIYVNLAEALSAQLKVAMLAAVLCTLPLLIWQAWRFVQPAFYPVERPHAWRLLIITLGLFAVGIVFGYAVVFVTVISFFVSSGQGFAKPLLSISSYVSFLLGFVLPFGLAFELPVACYALGRVGIVTYENLIAARRYVILIIFTMAAILTPPDVLSQVMMAVPLCFLYEVSIFVLRVCRRHENIPMS
jgi:sec-independent protein translocase protein TatC